MSSFRILLNFTKRCVDIIDKVGVLMLIACVHVDENRLELVGYVLAAHVEAGLEFLKVPDTVLAGFLVLQIDEVAVNQNFEDLNIQSRGLGLRRGDRWLVGLVGFHGFKVSRRCLDVARARVDMTHLLFVSARAT